MTIQHALYAALALTIVTLVFVALAMGNSTDEAEQ